MKDLGDPFTLVIQGICSVCEITFQTSVCAFAKSDG